MFMAIPEVRLENASLGEPDSEARASSCMSAVMDLLRVANDALPNGERRVRELLAQASALIDSTGGGATDPRSLAERCFRPGGFTRWQASRVDEYIDAHLCETIRMASLAAVTNLSTSHFFHAFRATFGESPYRYVVRRRIEAAKALMISSGRSLADIALDCGFADQPHMTRQFKQFVGATPAAWRRLGQLSGNTCMGPAEHSTSSADRAVGCQVGIEYYGDN